MAMRKIDRVNGPIPGEHLTSEERNYPWHREPDFDDLNVAMDFVVEQLEEDDVLFSGLNMLENGVTVAEITQLFLMGKMMEGRFTLDYALLLAGPVAKYISIMAEKFNVPAPMGVDSNYMYIPKGLVEGAARDQERIDEIKSIQRQEEIASDSEGLMSDITGGADIATEEEQAAMLGYSNEEENA